jgi:hypothetical protein
MQLTSSELNYCIPVHSIAEVMKAKRLKLPFVGYLFRLD